MVSTSARESALAHRNAVIALAGNPNAGKTSTFNALTGAFQQVSNYPGVTVSIKEGTAHHAGVDYSIVDLPGIYSLTAYSQEEMVARNFILDGQVDVVVDVLDSSNLERNLYLAAQLLEMRTPMVLALNMMDIAHKRGITLDARALSVRIGVPVVVISGNRGEGMPELLAACASAIAAGPPEATHTVDYGHEVEEAIERLTADVAGVAELAARYEPRWLAVKLVENDESAGAVVQQLGATFLLERAQAEMQVIERHYHEDAATVIAERRYGFAAGATRDCTRPTGEARQFATERIDAVMCHRVLGPILLVAVVASLFVWVFKISDEWAWIPWFGGWLSPTGWMAWCFEELAQVCAPLENEAPMLHSLIAHALIGGVGGVMEFVPLIFVMFLFIAALEDTGYVARVAFILDKVLHIFGMQGKSIIAMIVSGGLGAGGCAVPGVLATRTLREEKDRLVTMLVVPFMNCGAKMPVYAMLIAAFFPAHRTPVMLVMWLLSWCVALGAAWFLRHYVIRGEQTPFVMELPPYHIPVLRSVVLHAWDRTWMYGRKAGTIILCISVLMWALMYFPQLPEDAGLRMSPNERAAAGLAHSFAGRVGQAMAPVSELAGFDWQTNIALMGGFAAKEVVVGTLGTSYSMGEIEAKEASPLSERLAKDPDWDAVRAFAMMVFVMIYAPCLATMSAIRRESGSWKWALFSTGFNTAVAFVLAVVVFQTGRAMGLGHL